MSSEVLCKGGLLRVIWLMFYVYIIQSISDHSHYVGMTTDVQKRIVEHNQGQTTYTSGHGPYKLVWFCGFRDKKKALDFEKYLKSGSGFAFARKHLS